MPAHLWLRDRLPRQAYSTLEWLAHQRPAHRRWASGQREIVARRSALDDQVVAALATDLVQSGPLRGTRLNRDASWGLDYSARLLGSYEKELHPYLESLASATTPSVVDVGCADGYYVAGLGRLASGASVTAYDVDPRARRVTRALAEVNDVSDRVEINGACRSVDLEGLPPGSLVLMDCEGAEVTLITAAVARSNTDTAFVIECHESIVDGITERLMGLFEGRVIDVVEQQPRSPADYPALPEHLARAVLDELRSPADRWLVIR